MSQRGLGRGLSAILPGARGKTDEVAEPEHDEATHPEPPGEPSDVAERESRALDGPVQPITPDGAEFLEIPIDQIKPNARQPRQVVEDGSLAELTASIRSVGLLQPVIVRRFGDGFELVAGERRWRACRAAGLERIPAIVREAADDAMLRDALIENLQRVDLNPLEEAAAYRQLVDDLGATHEEIADRVGKSRAAITNSLRLLNLSAEVQGRIASGQLSAAHGRAIAALADPAAQARASQRVAAEQLNVRQTEELVRTMATSGEVLRDRAGKRDRAVPDRPAGVLEAEALIAEALGTRVHVEAGRGRGKVVVEFADLEDLDRIVRHIAGER